MDRTEKKKVNSEIEDIKWNINTCVAQSQLLVREKTKVTEVVYHLPEKSGNFGWNVNGKTIFFFPNGNFHGKMGILER